MFSIFIPQKCDELLIQPCTQIYKHTHLSKTFNLLYKRESYTKRKCSNSDRVDRIVQPLGIYYIII